MVLRRYAGASPVTSTKKENYAPGKLFRVRVFCLQMLFRLESKTEIAFIFCKIEYAIKNGFRLDISRNPFHYRLTSRILLPSSGSGCSTSRREYQLHRENKYLKIEYLSKSQTCYRVWLFFYFYDTFFATVLRSHYLNQFFFSFVTSL